MIYRYIDKEKSGFKGGLRVSKFPLREHYIIKKFSSDSHSSISFLKLLNLLVVEGYSLNESIDLILDSKERGVDFKIVSNIKSDLNKGMPFQKSLCRHFNMSNFDATLIKVAEKEGNLKEVLGDVILNISEKEEMKNRTKRALYYPFFLLFMGLILMIFISKFVAPMFLNVINDFGGDLPFVSRIAFSFSKILSSSGFSIFLVLVSIFILFYLMIIKFPNFEIVLRRCIYRSKTFGLIYRAKFQYMFFKEFGFLYKYSGNYKEVMKFIIDESTDIYIKKTLSKALNKISYGLKFEEIDEFYELFSSFSMSIFSKLNREEVVLNATSELSKLYKSKYDDYLDSILKLIGPLMVLFIGGIVAIVALGIMLPIFNLGNNL